MITATAKRTLPSWYSDGHKIEATTIEEVLKQGGLDWKVSKRPIATTAADPVFAGKNDINPIPFHPNGSPKTRALKTAVQQLLKDPINETFIEATRVALRATRGEFLTTTREFAIVRDDIGYFITTVGAVYTTLENDMCISVLHELMHNFGAVVERAGTFNGGASCWVIAKLSESMSVGMETIDQYIRIGWSHDGTEKLTARFLYVVTSNGLVLSPAIQKTKVEIAIRHTKTGPQRIIEATNLMKKQQEHASALESIIDEMVNTECTDLDLHEYLEALFPKCNDVNTDIHGADTPTHDAIIMKELQDTLQHQNPHSANTLWGGYLSVMDYVDNKRTVRVHGKEENCSDKQAEQMKVEMRNRNTIRSDGASMQIKQKAWAALTAPLT